MVLTHSRGWALLHVTPTNNSANNVSSMRSKVRVPRLTISSDEITKIGEIETSIFSTRHKSCKQPKFKKLQLIYATDPTKMLSDLWQCAWFLKPHRPMWSGFMQMVHNSNDHPAKSEVIFLPMIDMQSSDPSCIL